VCVCVCVCKKSSPHNTHHTPHILTHSITYITHTHTLHHTHRSFNHTLHNTHYTYLHTINHSPHTHLRARKCSTGRTGTGMSLQSLAKMMACSHRARGTVGQNSHALRPRTPGKGTYVCECVDMRVCMRDSVQV
jgi:hypothetical protein